MGSCACTRPWKLKSSELRQRELLSAKVYTAPVCEPGLEVTQNKMIDLEIIIVWSSLSQNAFTELNGRFVYQKLVCNPPRSRRRRRSRSRSSRISRNRIRRRRRKKMAGPYDVDLRAKHVAVAVDASPTFWEGRLDYYAICVPQIFWINPPFHTTS